MSRSGDLVPGRQRAVCSCYAQLTPFLLPWLVSPCRPPAQHLPWVLRPRSGINPRALGSILPAERMLLGSRVPAGCPGTPRMEQEGGQGEPGRRWLCLSSHHSRDSDTLGVIYGFG